MPNFVVVRDNHDEMYHRGVTSLSIITAADPTRLMYLSETRSSVEALKSAVAFPVEWVLTLDGPSDSTVVGPDVVLKCAAKGGVAAARNLALAEASGEVIFPLDADDLAEPDGLNRLMDLLSQDSELGWVSGNRLYVDGARTPHWVDLARSWTLGELGEDWTSPFYFHPNCLLFRRSLALQAGGWPALRTNEDLALLFAIGRLAKGRSEADVLLRYRKWSGQVTAADSYLLDKSLAFRFIESVENQWRTKLDLPLIKKPNRV